VTDTIKKQIIRRLDGLSDEEQRRALDFVGSLSARTPEGVSGGSLLRFAGAFDPEEARKMARAIEEGCERINVGGW
jgi:acetyl-CoA carboxylase carboxyltransferase component